MVKEIKYDETWVPTTPPWMVCAANRYGECIISGPRHHDDTMRKTTALLGGWDGYGGLESPKFGVYWKKGWKKLLAGGDEEQGFLDQWGRFYTRMEASYVAAQNGQCSADLMGCGICSEDLY